MGISMLFALFEQCSYEIGTLREDDFTRNTSAITPMNKCPTSHKMLFTTFLFLIFYAMNIERSCRMMQLFYDASDALVINASKSVAIAFQC